VKTPTHWQAVNGRKELARLGASCRLLRERASTSGGWAAGRIDQAVGLKELLEPFVLCVRRDLMAGLDRAGSCLWDFGAPFRHVRSPVSYWG
jgi:hypothetical protein